MKKRGFRLEEPHLPKLDGLKKRMGIVSMAFVLCWQVGYYPHQHRSPIALKNHVYKANSLFRNGFDLVRGTCKFVEKGADFRCTPRWAMVCIALELMSKVGTRFVTIDAAYDPDTDPVYDASEFYEKLGFR